MNIYFYVFNSVCPNNGRIIQYELEIQTNDVIMVEDIIKQCEISSTFHEPLADRLYQIFGGRQSLTATHHGVRIQTLRGVL